MHVLFGESWGNLRELVFLDPSRTRTLSAASRFSSVLTCNMEIWVKDLMVSACHASVNEKLRPWCHNDQKTDTWVQVVDWP
jgi:hypothetical protein